MVPRRYLNGRHFTIVHESKTFKQKVELQEKSVLKFAKKCFHKRINISTFYTNIIFNSDDTHNFSNSPRSLEIRYL